MGEEIVKRLSLAGGTVITTARNTPDELMDSDLFIQMTEALSAPFDYGFRTGLIYLKYLSGLK